MNWLKYRFFYFGFSLLFIIPGVFSLIRYGFKPSVEFTGGSVLEIQLSSPDSDSVNQAISEGHEIHSINTDQSKVSVELEPIDQSQVDDIINKIKEIDESAKLISFVTVGPSIGRQLLTKALTAISIAAIMTLLYIAYAFKNITFGVFAVIAMLHDTIILLGSYSILGVLFNIQADLLFVTAVLTTLSFSVHDTIVVFDRIRELKTKTSGNLFTVANQAITETMARSINNSLTIIFMLLALVLLGGSSIHNFALALLIGAITGTYSSTFTAVPLLVTWDTIKNR